MKTKIAQAATFAFSAVGALAIFVGAVNYPATAANAAGAPAVGLFGAASTPAVSPMACPALVPGHSPPFPRPRPTLFFNNIQWSQVFFWLFNLVFFHLPPTSSPPP